MNATSRLVLLLLLLTLFAGNRTLAQTEAPESPGAEEFQFDFDTDEFDVDGFGAEELSTELSPAEIAISLACYGGFLLILLSVWIAILLLFSKSLEALPEQHRLMSPGQVWLLLIPLFNIVWIFFVFTRIPKSFRSYFYAIGRTDVGDCGEQIGLWYCICAVCSIIPCIGIIPGIASFVLLILFVVKIVDLKKQVQSPGNLGMASP